MKLFPAFIYVIGAKVNQILNEGTSNYHKKYINLNILKVLLVLTCSV
jgi:hypothetical protein